jgi:hypothetical protein
MYARLPLGLLAKALILAICLGLSLPPPAEAGPLRSDAASASMFYSKLAPYGTWATHPAYGRIWFPRNVPDYWRPYQDGYWEYTADYGWLWVSDWEWGWATDHYGRWVWDDWYGWIWVPGAVWAPAWVVWRYGDGYVSWAPMPIQYIWNPYASYTAYYSDFDRYLSWDCWVTTRKRDFPRKNMPRKWLPPGMNRDILQRTRYTDPLTVIDKRVVNRGVPINLIERATGLPFKPAAPTIVNKPFENKSTERLQKRRGEVLIYRPIGSQPTAKTVRDEAEFDRALAERIDANRSAFDNKGEAGQNRTLRRPGRLSGRPKPLDYDAAENPLRIQPETHSTSPAFQPLPDVRKQMPPAPVRDESVDQSSRKHEAGRGSHDPGDERILKRTKGFEGVPQGGLRAEELAEQKRRQQWELGRQQQAEEQRMRQEVSDHRQEQTTRRQWLELEQQQRLEQEQLQQEVMRQQQETRRRQPRDRGEREAEQERIQQELLHQRQLDAEQRQQPERQRMQWRTIQNQQPLPQQPREIRQPETRQQAGPREDRGGRGGYGFGRARE